MTKEEYKNLLLNNAYINLENVLDFLKNNFIADFEVISEIYNKGMSQADYEALQEAIEEIENGTDEEDN